MRAAGRQRVVHWLRQVGWGGSRLPPRGDDHDAGHRGYVEALDPASRAYLETKPFRAPPNHELAISLRLFADLVELLDLEPRAQVLDVGCGPGWVSEYLARCGYWVVGVDVCEDMLSIARARVEGIDPAVGYGIEPAAEFACLHATDLPWQSRFDAVVMVDALHHLADEHASLARARRALRPGGTLLIHEAPRPREGSPEELELLREMDERKTLESPFDPGAMRRALERAGFVSIRRLASLGPAIPAGRPWPALLRGVRRALAPRWNLFVAHAPGGRPRSAAPRFAGRLSLLAPPRRVDDRVECRLRVENVGRAWWPATGPNGEGVTVGTVRLAPHLLGTPRIELERVPIPDALAPAQHVELTAHVRLPGEHARADAIAVDLVAEGMTWFSEAGGREPFTVRIDPGPPA